MAVLKEAKVVDKVVSSLRLGATWSDWAQAVAFEALDTTARAMRHPASFRDFCKIFARSPTFVTDSIDGTRANIPLITTALWKSRDSFLTLCSHGLLPGSALFLLALLNILPTHPNIGRTRKELVFLQELGFRLYLVGSPRDRQILPYVCMSAAQNNAEWASGNIRIASPKDSRAIAQAYIGLLLVSQQGSSTKSVPIAFMGDLAGFVLYTIGRNPSGTTNEMIDTGYATLQFLWLLLEDRG
ncbi:hypothetical protein FS749_001670 [Ceratobasidium sp. UAMH 11750]|nr:hypothetical protein FS749_001670 [Ceratobasidium sp. UAMH 11750]